jgi:hypothetical protein
LAFVLSNHLVLVSSALGVLLVVALLVLACGVEVIEAANGPDR